MFHRLGRGLLFVIAFAAAAAALDLYLQSAEIQCPLEFKLDRRIGLMYAPNFRFSRFSEGFYLGKTNEYGCLGKGARQERDGRTLRILFLGDSFALGHTVFERDHFARWIEKIVSRATGRPVEVLNFARADFALPNLYQHYRDFASRWKPDLALFFMDQTDINPYKQASGSFYPTAYVEADTLCYEYSFVNSGKARMFEKYGPILNHTVLPKMVFEFLKHKDQGDLPHILFDKLAAEPPPEIAPLEVEPVGSPPPPMPEVSRLVLERLARLPEAVIVLSGPTHPAYRKVIQDLGIRMLDLNPAFDALRAQGIDPYYWPVTRTEGHWNQAAHQAIGESLGKGVLEILSGLHRS